MSHKRLVWGLLAGMVLALCFRGILYPSESSFGKPEATLLNNQYFFSSEIASEQSQTINLTTNLTISEETKMETSPYLSKIGSTLDHLLTLRERNQIPLEMKDILMRDTVNVSIRFTHVLDDSEIRSLENLGLKLARLPDGGIAHSETIYGADVPWGRVHDLAKLSTVNRIESTWKPKIELPVSEGTLP
jgi:hypothetical protein